MGTNNINNLNALRYRKLLLRTEIKFKESEIKRQVAEMKTDLKGSDFRSEVAQMIIRNPMTVINAARVTFNLVRSWRQRKRNKQLRKKNMD